MNVCMKNRIDINGLMLTKQMHQNNLIFVIIGTLKMLVSIMNHIFAMVVMV